MKRKTQKFIILFFVLFISLAMTVSCGGNNEKGPVMSSEQRELTLIIKGDGINGEQIYTLEELNGLTGASFEHIYSTINNWPSFRFYAARGITVGSILRNVGVIDTVQVITFRSPDSYEVSFTREQLLDTPQYYFPKVAEGSTDEAERVEPIIAYEYKEGANDMEAIVPDAPCLIIGQRNPNEHTNPAFVVNVAEIIVSENQPEAWEQATAFPAEGMIPAGESVKLQHPSLGLVKLHYTLDGSDPTEYSPLYNPSTYQPELNVPIRIAEDTVIKVLVTGYGKEDSSIAKFAFKVRK